MQQGVARAVDHGQRRVRGAAEQAGWIHVLDRDGVTTYVDAGHSDWIEPDQMAHLLRERQDRQKPNARAKERHEEVSAHRALQAQRKELNKLVSAYARKTGTKHAIVHSELRQVCGGPALDQASGDQVTERIDKIRNWFVGRR